MKFLQPVLGPHLILTLTLAFLLIVSTQTVIRRSSFRHKREALHLSDHLYLSTTRCSSPIQCAVACLSVLGCVLTDLDSGDLYNGTEAQGSGSQVIKDYVESQVQKLSKTGPEINSGNLDNKAEAKGLGTIMITHGVESQENVDNNGPQKHSVKASQERNSENSVESEEVDKPVPRTKNQRSILMLSQTGNLKARQVYKASMSTNITADTGVSIKSLCIVSYIAYDRNSNTLFWSVLYEGIFKQVLESGSDQEKSSKAIHAEYLNIYNKTLVFCVKDGGDGSNIYIHDPLKRNSKVLWLSVKKQISYLVIDGDKGCWVETDKLITRFLICMEMSSRRKIYTKLMRMNLADMSLVTTSEYGMLVYAESEKGFYCIRSVEIVGNTFRKHKTLKHDLDEIGMKVVSGLLAVSFPWTGQVEIWELKQDGGFGGKIFSTILPDYKTSQKPILVDFL